MTDLDELSPLRFFAIWVTPPSTFSPRFHRSLESVFKHHPTAHLDVLSNSLPATFFHSLTSRTNHSIKIRRYDLASLTKGTRAEVWYAFRRFWSRSAFFPNHEADLLRLLWLAEHGGVYLDTDVVFVRPLDVRAALAGGGGVVGVESGGGGAAAPNRSATADGPIAPILAADAVLCNAVLAFAAGADFLRAALAEFVDDYVPYTPGLGFAELFVRGEWGWQGPLLLSRVARRRPETVRILERDVFYPISPGEVTSHMAPWDERRDGPAWERIRRRSVAVHFWNQLSRDRPLACGSLLWRLLDENCVVCEPLPCEEPG